MASISYSTSSFKFHFLFVLMVIGVSTSVIAQSIAKQGVLDARNFDFKNDRLSLNGDWKYFEDQLLSPVEVTSSKNEFSYFPKVWNETKSSGQGFATYSLQVIVPGQTETLALDIPQIYSSYQLWINGERIAANGKVGKTLEETQPQWMPQAISFARTSDTLDIVLQIANFHHHIGGPKDPIYLGTSESVQHNHRMAVASNLIEAILLGVVGLIFLVLYLITKKKKIIIYFALLCITWSIRAMFSDLYTFISFYPDFNWNAMVKIEYVTLFLTMIWAILFLGRVFVKDANKALKYVLVGSNIIFIAYSILMQPVSFTQWLPVYLSFCGILILYATILVLKALINERLGAGFLTISILLGVFIFSYDIFSYEGLFTHNPIVFSAGYIIIFSLMAVVLLLHLNIIKSKPKNSGGLTFDDLYKDNDRLTKL
jgi:hypothetical protein